MTNKNVKVSHRLLAAFMSLLMVLSVIPFSTIAFAATEEHPDAVTVTVKDEDGNPIMDATVKFTIDSVANGEKYIDQSQTTDENGVVEVLSKSDFKADDLTISAVVNADKYFEGNLESRAILSGDDNYDVILISSEIKDVTIEGRTLTYNGKPQELVSVTEVDGDTVDYGVLPEGVTLNEQGKPVATNAGKYNIEVTVKREGKDNLVNSVTATINPAEMDIDIAPVEGLKYNESEQQLVFLTGSLLESDTVTWKVNGFDTNSREIPKELAVAKYTVELIVYRDSNYEVFDKTVDVEIGLGELNIDGLEVKANDRIYDTTEKDSLIVNNQGDYSLQYKLDEGNWENVIPKICDAGNYKVYVKATKDGYNDKEYPTYPINVTIQKADQTLNFDNVNPENVDVTNSELVAGKTFDFKATDNEKLANGTVTYKINFLDGDPDIASIDENGLLTVKNAGVIEVTATLSGNNNYKDCSVSHIIQIGIVVNTSGELVKFTEKTKEYTIGDNNGIPVNKAEKTYPKKDTGKITYSVKDEEAYGLSIDKDSGKITVTDYNKLISATANAGGELNVTVRADKEEVKNKISKKVKFAEDYDTYTLIIKFLSTPEAPYELSNTDGTNDWYKTKAVVTPAEGYTVAKTQVNSKADNFSASVEFDNQGTQTRYIYLKETSTGKITDAIPVDIKIDSVAPDANNMTVNIKDLNIIEKLGSRFGFYNPEAEIEFTVEDETASDESGMKKFTWYYTKDVNSAASITADKSGDITPTFKDGKYVATLKIQASEIETYRGNISFTATDKAGNESAEKHDKDNIIIVVDKINPVMSAEFKLCDTDGNYNPVNTNGIIHHYYDGNVEFTFTIKEQNFFSEDVVVKVSKDGAEAQPVNPTWSDGDDDNHYGKFTLDEDGDYVVTMSYQDQSKNVMIDETEEEIPLYTSEIITIDTIDPQVMIEYTHDGDTQKTKFTVNEHNFRASDVVVSGSMKDINKNDIAFTADELTKILQSAEWKEKDGIYTYEYDEYIDGIYNLTIDYKDISMNNAEPYTADEFIIDHTAPNDVSIEILTSPLNTILGAITYGFYNPDVKVRITAYDNTSGVKSFTWNYTKENDASDLNRPTDEILTTVTAVQDDIDKSKFTAEITLPDTSIKQLRGYLAAYATDNFENGKNASNKVTDTGNVVIVDTVAPNVSVEYSTASRVIDTAKKAYYNGNIDATVIVDEANFYAEDVVVKVSKNGGAAEEVNPTWTNGDKDIHLGEFTLTDDGHYIITVEYTDKSNNTAVKYSSNELTIDTIKPIIDVAYNNISAVNTLTDTENHIREYFDDTQTAVVTIKEHNFNADEVDFKIIAKDVSGKELNASELSSKTDWSVDSTGDVHKITITYPGDANYTFDVAYTDLATNSADDYKQDYFTVDKTAPENLSVNYSASVLDTVLESVTFGFYNAKMTVTLTAEDPTSEIHSFLYSYINANGVSSVNAELIKQIISAADIKYSDDRKTATATFEIPKLVLKNDNQFNGTVEFTATDRSGNESNVKKETKRIIVDNIAPTVKVEYSEATNIVGDVSYYSGDINATVTVNEANFYQNDVQVMVSKDGAAATAVSPNWTNNSVDVHKGTFTLTGDGDYVVTINYADKSSNAMDTYTSKQMTIDTKIQPPTYSINGAAKSENGGAYKGEATVAFNFEDQNFDSKTIKLTRTRFNSVEDVTEKFIKVSGKDKGGSGSFSIPAEVENDGIYVLQIGMTDRAKHTTKSQMKFTINRYGSVYEYSDYLASLIKDGGQYIKIDGNNDAAITQNLVITEYNANQILSDSLKILITRDGETIDAKYTSNPAINSSANIGSSGWYQYEYTISKENFAEDGVYKITLASEYATSDSEKNDSTSVPDNSIDEAGNKILDTITFTVDTKKPEIRNVVNLDKAIVNAQNLDVKYTIVDVGGLKSIEVIVNGQIVDSINDFSDNAFTYSGQFTLNESSNEQTVQIKAIDLAGNITDTESEDFTTNDVYVFNDKITVSTNFFVRWYANKPLFWGSIGGVVALTGLIWFLVAFKRRKKDKEESK